MRRLLIRFLVWTDEKSLDWRWVEWLNRHVIDRNAREGVVDDDHS
jgi:hypothetical protein